MTNYLYKLCEVGFNNHPIDDSRKDQMAAIRKKALELALLIADNVPNCREQYSALNALRECVMGAGNGIANGDPDLVEKMLKNKNNAS